MRNHELAHPAPDLRDPQQRSPARRVSEDGPGYRVVATTGAARSRRSGRTTWAVGVRRQVELPEGTLPPYRAERTAEHHRGPVRRKVGVKCNQGEALRIAERSIRREAAAKNRPADLIDIALEKATEGPGRAARAWRNGPREGRPQPVGEG
ncbi:hypothetical protein [Streptomyces sp. NBC_01185]|uniref:hypothetical protein n=1 Tax=Streptomyces sp. NBC_01185 TaxID=2903764 RepID=UPI0038630ACC|nr:hypothetical protein OG770_21630 [Streptomyces sp. NBC_01185]